MRRVVASLHPLIAFMITAQVPEGSEPLYTPVRQVQHVISTLQAVREGVGSWEGGAGGRSLSANAVYEDNCDYEAIRQKYNAGFAEPGQEDGTPDGKLAVPAVPAAAEDRARSSKL